MEKRLSDAWHKEISRKAELQAAVIYAYYAQEEKNISEKTQCGKTDSSDKK